eukprot:COSAG02_NODE_5427_length_4339_cov_2.935377_1_plen_99_part_10
MVQQRGLITELCVLRTFGGVDFSLVFICAQSVSEFFWDRLRASIQFPVMPKRSQYARFSGEDCHPVLLLVAELCVLRTFGGLDFSLVFICAQSVPDFLW